MPPSSPVGGSKWSKRVFLSLSVLRRSKSRPNRPQRPNAFSPLFPCVSPHSGVGLSVRPIWSLTYLLDSSDASFLPGPLWEANQDFDLEARQTLLLRKGIVFKRRRERGERKKESFPKVEERQEFFAGDGRPGVCAVIQSFLLKKIFKK